MRKCTGNNTRDWDANAIFDVKCGTCGGLVEFFQDEITRPCPQCGEIVNNGRKTFGCGQWCSSSSTHIRNYCSNFKRSKDRFNGNNIG